jgi:uronate dehydrogenase
MPRFNRILLTGAAGELGKVLRASLAPMATRLRLNDRFDLGPTAPHEEPAVADLADADAVMAMVDGVDAIVHFGGASRERPWQDVLDSTIRGSYHLYEAARRHGVPRVIFASSIHAVGFAASEAATDERSPHMPDTLYGVSKCFVEDLSKLYWSKWGIETACLRILSCVDQPQDRRHLATWLSHGDLAHLVERCLLASRIGHTVIYGVSANAGAPVVNRHAGHIGYRPKDDGEAHRDRIEAATPPADPNAPHYARVGGWYTSLPHPDDPA